jgi:hypothetical protein
MRSPAKFRRLPIAAAVSGVVLSVLITGSTAILQINFAH